MSWAVVIGAGAGLATMLILGPTGYNAVLRTPEQPASVRSPSRRPRRTWRSAADPLAEDLYVQRYLEALARALRAGRTLHDALLVVQPGDGEPRATRLVHDTVRLAATAGTGPATVIEHAAWVAADRVTDRQERRSQAAQARLSANVLTWVPVVVAALALIADDDIRRVMLTTPLGWICVGTGSALSALGRRWIRRITDGPHR